MNPLVGPHANASHESVGRKRHRPPVRKSRGIVRRGLKFFVVAWLLLGAVRFAMVVSDDGRSDDAVTGSRPVPTTIDARDSAVAALEPGEPLTPREQDAGVGAVTRPEEPRALLGVEAERYERPITPGDVEGDWPLTTGAGTLVCEIVPAPVEMPMVFFVDAGGRAYAVNELAEVMVGAPDVAWGPLDPIRGPGAPGTVGRADVAPLVWIGTSLCPTAGDTGEPTELAYEETYFRLDWSMSSYVVRATTCKQRLTDPEGLWRSALEGRGDQAALRPIAEAILDESC